MSTEAGELAAVLAGALLRCDLIGLPFNGHHTPKPKAEPHDPSAAHEAFRNNPDDPRHGSLNGYSNSAGLPSQFQSRLNRVRHLESTGVWSCALRQLRPPSTDTSTCLTLPRPDHARPLML